MKTTRQLICEHLQLKQMASADEMAHALRVTPANIRHHLSALISEGVVEKVGQRSTPGRGRPIQLFSMVEQASRNNLELLVKALLSERKSEGAYPDWDEFYKHLAVRLLGEKQRPPRNQAQRYYQAIQQLNQMNYGARWEAHARAPHVIFSHCPYTAVIDDHPELCLMDKYILEELLGEEAIQSAKLTLTPQGTRLCIFLIGI
jgi:predicted ArsR family transcriptional regulator